MKLTFQNYNRQILKESFSNNLLLIRGKEHSGREYCIKEFFNEKNDRLFVELKSGKTDLSSIENGLASCEATRKQMPLRLTPNISISTPIGIGFGISVSKEQLGKKEKQLLKLLKKLSKKFFITFFIRDFESMDSQSQLFINKLISNIESDELKHKFQIIIFDNETLSTMLYQCGFCRLQFKSLEDESFDEFKGDMKLMFQDNVDEDVLRFIYCNINSNIEVLNGIISACNAKKISFTKPTIDTEHKIEKIFSNHSSNKSDIGFLLLKFIATIDENLSKNELAFLVNERQNLVTIELNERQDKYILKESNGKWRFTFDLLKDVFGEKNERERLDIYNRLLCMYKTLYPSRYEMLYHYSLRIHAEHPERFYIKGILQKIRQDTSFCVNKNDLEKKISNGNYVSFIINYQTAYNIAEIGNYAEAIEMLRAFSTDSWLQLEANLLMSQYMIKSLYPNIRQQAMNLLTLDYEISDEDLNYRYAIRRIAAYVHIGKYLEAKREYDATINRIQNGYGLTESQELLDKEMLLYRRSNNVLSSDLAYGYIKSAAEYYKNSDNLFALYISYCNLFAIQIINYDLSGAKQTKENLEQFILNHARIAFPRSQIFQNDEILYKYFTGEIDTETAEGLFETLLRKIGGDADKIFYSSNYAIFMALNGKLSDAIELLESLKRKEYQDQEGIYDLRIYVNLAIFKYLENPAENREYGMRQVENCLNSLDPNIPDYSWQKNKLLRIRNMFEQGEAASVADWRNKFEENLVPNIIDCQNYYGKAFLFTVVFNWDDD